jgi:hypothetical protein
MLFSCSVGRLEGGACDKFAHKVAERQLTHAKVLFNWKCSLSWGLITEDQDDKACAYFVCCPFKFPPSDDCTSEDFAKRIQLYDIAFQWWEERMGEVMCDRALQAAASGKVGRFTESGDCQKEEQSAWDEAIGIGSCMDALVL